MFNIMPLLSSVIWAPVFTGVLLIFCTNHKFTKTVKIVTCGMSLYTLTLCAYLWSNYNPDVWQMQFVEQFFWLPTLDIKYSLGLDGFSLPLIFLTCFMNLIVIIAALPRKDNDLAKYFASFLIMQGLMCGVFLATDAILFFVFFEAMMIPMFMIIGLWGGDNRVYATIKFILYTLFGSLFLLVCLLYLNNLTGSFNIADFQNANIEVGAQSWLFWGMFIAFAIKIPMIPVHTWLPDAHVEAPTGGSVILAAITLKMGGYGMIRFLLPITPVASFVYAPYVISLSLIAIAYIGFIAIVQKDMKKLIAYSSISHMGFVTLGLFVIFNLIYTNQIDAAAMGIEGAMMQMISHGFISGALFLCVGVLYTRMKSKQISDFGGVANSMPVFASFFMLFAMANAGLPGTSGFVGEFLVILTTFKASFAYTFVACTTLILGATYTLWMYKRVMFGEVKNQAIAALDDLNITEITVFTLLAFAILLIGVWPSPILDIMHGTSEHLVQHLVKGNM